MDPSLFFIGLDMLNFDFVHFKKLAKIQFLKNGST